MANVASRFVRDIHTTAGGARSNGNHWASLSALFDRSRSSGRRWFRGTARPTVGESDGPGQAMLRSQAGDAAAYREVLGWSARWLRVFYEYHCPELDAAGVNDAVRQTLSALHAKRHTFEAHCTYARWLEAVARHKAPFPITTRATGALVTATA